MYTITLIKRTSNNIGIVITFAVEIRTQRLRMSALGGPSTRRVREICTSTEKLKPPVFFHSQAQN